MGKIEDILHSACELFAAKGYENTPVAEIATKAGVAGGTIIYHFQSKDNLLYILVRQIVYNLYKATRQNLYSATSGLHAVELFVHSFIDYVKSNPHEYKVLVKNADLEEITLEFKNHHDTRVLFKSYTDLLESSIQRGIDDGSIKPIPVRETAMIILSMMIGTARICLYSGIDHHTLTQEMMNFISARLT
jgi:TetR/AcrR family fatty acid metabolism transcriptional regulator